jgi:hypothetical protein
MFVYKTTNGITSQLLSYDCPEQADLAFDSLTAQYEPSAAGVFITRLY